MKTAITTTISILLALTTHAQMGNNWVFGYHGGINFTGDSINFFQSSIESINSVTNDSTALVSNSISDCNGNILFYGTNCQIWNKNHQPMLNGDFGCSQINANRTTKPVILPMPDSSHKYYYISLAWDTFTSSFGVNFSVIDMNLDNGNGGVMEAVKDIRIPNLDSVGKITFAPHQNNKEFWLIARKRNELISYKVTSQGIEIIPKKTPTVGTWWGVQEDAFTHDYANFAYPVYSPYDINNNAIYSYSFNRFTGRFSNPVSLLKFTPIACHQVMALEFSPDNTKLYAAVSWYDGVCAQPFQGAKIYQIDLANNNSTTLLTTFPTYIDGITTASRNFGSLRLAENGKIYGSLNSSITTNIELDTMLYVIHNPDEVAANVNVDTIPSLYEAAFLPESYYLRYNLTISTNADQNGCVRDTTQIYVSEHSEAYSSYIMYFGDGDSIVVDTPMINNIDTIYHLYSEGSYEISIKAYTKNCGLLKEYADSISIRYKPGLFLFISDSTACWEHHYTVRDSSINANSTKIVWGNGDSIVSMPNNTANYFYTTEGNFNYQYIAYGNQCSDTIIGQFISSFLPKPHVRLGINDTAYCTDEGFTLTDTNTNYVGRRVDWGDGNIDTNLFHIYLDTGRFNVFVTDTNSSGCTNTDSLILTAKDLFIIDSAGTDFTQFCEDVTLNYGYNYFNADSLIIKWGDGNTDYTDIFTNTLQHTYGPGNFNFSLYVFNDQCTDTIYVNPILLKNPPIAAALVDDGKLCEGQSYNIRNESVGATYYSVDWGDGNVESFGNGVTDFNHDYTTPASLTVTIVAFNSENCPDTFKLPVEVLNRAQASFDKLLDSACRPLQLGITNTSVDYNEYSIDWGDGSSVFVGPPLVSLSHLYLNKGTYLITLKVNNGFCADSAYGSIKVTGLSGNEISTLVVASVEGSNATYIEWEPVVGAQSYNLFRSSNGSNYYKVATNLQATSYFDNPPTDANYWYYKVYGVDSCNNLSAQSNLGRTVFLEGAIGDKNSSALLQWTPYIDWDGGVLYYEIQEQDKFGNFNTINSQDSLYKLDTNFLDLNLGLEHKCYRVVAYEAGTNNAVSKSNVVCLPYAPVFWAPTAFTPNDDGINDTWGIEFVAIEDFTFEIYNRWGEKVFESQFPTDRWDGSNGQVGVYMFVIKGVGYEGKPFVAEGVIHLLR